MTYRILVTGSRDWKFANTVHQALLAELFRAREWGYYEAALIHGACPRGADRQADVVWTQAYMGAGAEVALMAPERYPGNQFDSFKDRNQHMVDLGAHVCLAFATDWKSGTGQTARMARRAGIRTRDYGVETT